MHEITTFTSQKKIIFWNIIPAQTSTHPPTEPHTHLWHALQSSTSVRFTCECMLITQVFFNWKYYVLRKNSKFGDWSLYLRRRPQTHSHHTDPETRLSGKSWRQFPHSTQSGALAQCLFSVTFPRKQSWLYLIFLILLSIDDHRVVGALKWPFEIFLCGQD